MNARLPVRQAFICRNIRTEPVDIFHQIKAVAAIYRSA